MTNFIGAQPGRIYTPADFRQGRCPARGTRYTDNANGGKEYLLCEVAAAQNLISGTVVTVSSGFVVTVAAVAVGNTRADQLAIAITTATASASMFIWCQIFGRCSVLASTSILPNIGLKIGTTAGVLTTAGATTASAHTPGIILTATSGVVPALTAAILNYPRYGSSSNF